MPNSHFIDIGGGTFRINTGDAPNSYIGLQIMMPPMYKDEVLTEPGSFTQLYISKAVAKQIADILHAESVMELVIQR